MTISNEFSDPENPGKYFWCFFSLDFPVNEWSTDNNPYVHKVNNSFNLTIDGYQNVRKCFFLTFSYFWAYFSDILVLWSIFDFPFILVLIFWHFGTWWFFWHFDTLRTKKCVFGTKTKKLSPSLSHQLNDVTKICHQTNLRFHRPFIILQKMYSYKYSRFRSRFPLTIFSGLISRP